MRKHIISVALLLSAFFSFAQQTVIVDSLKKSLANAATVEAKVSTLDVLSRTLMNVNLQEAEKYGKQLIELAEESRDRKLMIKAYMSNGTRCSYFAGTKDYIQQSIGYYNKALEIAKQNNMDEQTGRAWLQLAAIHLSIPDKDKALNYVDQAFSLISGLKNDTLKATAHNSYGDVYLSRNDKILALRNYLNALRLAENLKDASLMRKCYTNLSGFYSNIEDYDKAIDYLMKAHKKLDDIKEGNVAYQRAIDLNSIGALYARKKSFDIAINYFERSLTMADSLKFPNLKVPAYISLLNQYLRMDQPAKALAYFNSPGGQNLKEFLKNFGFSGAIDEAYGIIYTELGNYDSAGYYFNKAAPYFEKVPNEMSKINYYYGQGNLNKKTGNNNKAIDLFLKLKEIAVRMGQLEIVQNVAKELDTLYTKTGNYQLASQYTSIYYQYKDSIQKLNKEKELAQIEADDEQQRQERMALEAQERKTRRDNIQYLAITIGIVVLFFILVMMGMFRVSAGMIKMVGFFAFLMFFEFVFLILKKNIYSLTQGEPWKDLAFMIGLAALLLPLHHWLEHKVISYLTSHNLIKVDAKGLLARLRKQSKPGKH